MTYLPDGKSFFKKRFFVEASGTLPIEEGEDSIEKVFEALSMKRVNLRRDQGIEEWNLEWVGVFGTGGCAPRTGSIFLIRGRSLRLIAHIFAMMSDL